MKNSSLLRDFDTPNKEFSIMPFWLINDTLDLEKMFEQIDDLKAKGVDGFVFHPRMGMARTPEYLSDEYMDYVAACVERAKQNDMKVILYDEAAYPSGSAHGLVAKTDPMYASRRLQKRPLDTLELSENESVFLYVSRTENGEYHSAKKAEELPEGEKYALAECPTFGYIRGIYDDEDDGMPNAPASADLLNPAAVDCFIRLTHDKYYSRLSEHFGKTVIGFFTDEPSICGRGAKLDNSIIWSGRLIDDIIAAGGSEETVISVLFDREDSKDAWRIYGEAVRIRLERDYYGKLSAWCVSHGIDLMGHPADSGDMDSQKFFGVPGQDLVWQQVAPDKPLDSWEGVMGKCSSDAARMLGARRNSNEVLGVCGRPGNPWDFTVSDMLWYFNFLFVRGVNLLIPHAFYYSLRTKVQSNERPPDVGLNNIWWEDYRMYSDYVKRMCALNTDSYNHPYAAVLAPGQTMPQTPVVPLYENQIEFNYINENFLDRAEIVDGGFRVKDNFYNILLVSYEPQEKTERFIKEFEAAGGKVCRNAEDFLPFVRENAALGERLSPACANIRLSHQTKDGIHYYILTNEGKEAYFGTLRTSLSGRCYALDPMTGEKTTLFENPADGMREIPVCVTARVAAVLVFDPDEAPLIGSAPKKQTVTVIPENGKFILPEKYDKVTLTLSEVHDMCDVSVNGSHAARLRYFDGIHKDHPWSCDITAAVRPGENTLDFAVTGSMSNTYGAPVPVGIGECMIYIDCGDEK